jgi:hypothetical protein
MQVRSNEEMTAISGALSLLTNIVMAWNTDHIQHQVDLDSARLPDSVISQVAPKGHAHINTREIMSFDLGRSSSALPGFANGETINRFRLGERRIWFYFNML